MMKKDVVMSIWDNEHTGAASEVSVHSLQGAN